MKDSFPQQLLDRIVEKSGIPGYLGNCHSSGTVILDELGEEHMHTGKTNFYTSADSVFQIACHEEIFGLEKLYELCRIVREELEGYNIGRVIACPFVGGRRGEFQRTGNRKDYAWEPLAKTVLQKLVEEKQGEVVSIGKIADIYAHTGITRKIKATGLEELFDKTLVEMKSAVKILLFLLILSILTRILVIVVMGSGLCFRVGIFDSRVPELLSLVTDEDMIIFTADHGCDPTWKALIILVSIFRC